MRALPSWRLGRSLVIGRWRPTAPCIRIIPTDACNLACAYCWQRGAGGQMGWDLFTACLANARRLDAGVISFLGGEPTLWPHLDRAVAACARAGLLTDLTSNGSRLDEEWLTGLASAGLHLLNLSVDALDGQGGSPKHRLGDPGFRDALRRVRRRTGLRVRINAVLGPGNIAEIDAVLDACRADGLPVSVGFAMPPGRAAADPAIHFTPERPAPVRAAQLALVRQRRRGCRIIDPPAYGAGLVRFLRGDRFWTCGYGSRRGWINVDPRGHVRDCTKRMGDLGIVFTDLRRCDLPALRRRLAEGRTACNPDCYSNCAFDGSWYARRPWELLTRLG